MYLKNVVVHFRSAVKHIDHCKHELALLCDAGATIKLRKYILATRKNDYFRLVIRPKYPQKEWYTTDSTMSLKNLRNVTKFCSNLVCDKWSTTKRAAVQLRTEQAELMQWRASDWSWTPQWFWSYAMARGKWHSTQMLVALKSDVYYCRYYLIKRRSQLDIDIAQLSLTMNIRYDAARLFLACLDGVATMTMTVPLEHATHNLLRPRMTWVDTKLIRRTWGTREMTTADILSRAWCC